MKSKIYLLLITCLIISCSPKTEENRVKTVPEPEKTTIDSEVRASSFIPINYSQFTYFKSGDTAYNKFIKNNFYTTLKDNYLFLDFKYSFSENNDMFFTRFNFDFNSIFKYIDRDVSFGVTDTGFFLVASMTLKSKVLTSLLNVAPENVIRETKEKGHKIYYINKESTSIFYTVVNDYIIFADSKKTVISALTSAINGTNSNRDYYTTLDDSELIYVKKLNVNNNPFDILPNLEEVEVVYHTENQSLKYRAYPYKEIIEVQRAVEPKPFETLKLLNEDLALVLYNSEYDFKNIVKSFATDNNRDRVKGLSDEIASKLKGTYFVAGDLSNLITGGSPELGLILNVVNGLEIEIEALELSSELLGVYWIENSLTPTVSFYMEQVSDFYMIISDSNIAIFTNRILADDYYSKLENKGVSLYDKHLKSLNLEKDPYSFICFNPEEINSSLEPHIKRYLFSNINMDDYEYQRSFGSLLNYFSGLKPGYMDLNYNREKGNFYGSVKQIP